MSALVAVQKWTSNADLIADVHSLYPLNKVRDVTYGRGMWWKKHQPAELLGTDIKDGINYLDLPDQDNSWPVVAFDPPYIPQGGRSTSTVPEFLDRFGLVEVCTTDIQLRNNIKDGLAECMRICEPNGLVLAKCMNYVFSGKFIPQVAYLVVDGQELGLDVLAQFIHQRQLGPQPSHNLDGSVRLQKTPRQNYSVLTVFRKPKTRKPK